MPIVKWNHRPKDFSILPEFHLKIHNVVSLLFIFSSLYMLQYNEYGKDALPTH